METIGLIAAMPLESGSLLHLVKGSKRIKLGPFNARWFDRCGQTCVLVTSGMGARRASEAARKLIEMSAPRMIISFGIAGAVEEDLQIGDVIAAEAVCQLEHGSLGQRLPLACWPEAAQAAAAEALSRRGARLLAGNALTTCGAQVLKNQFWNLAHPILEMETAGIARVAAEKGIPLFSLRAISDGPGAPIPFDLGEMMDEDANLKAGKLLMAVARRPGMIAQFGEVMRNSRTAADNAAIALVAALSQMAF